MAENLDNFTGRSSSVLALAQEEAYRFGHNYIGTEHLLLGIVREKNGVAARLLGGMGVDDDRVRRAVERIVGRGEQEPGGSMIVLAPRTKQVMRTAADEARMLNHRSVGTEHLLLALLRDGEGIAAWILKSMDVSLERVSQQLLQVVPTSGAPPLVEPVRPALLPSLGQLQRIAAVNQTQNVGGVDATILALELYQHGLVLHGRIRETDSAQLSRHGPSRLQPHALAMRDDRDTTYAMQSLRSVFIDEDSNFFSVRLVPALDVDARYLSLSLESRLGQEPQPQARQWLFELEL